MQLCHYCLKINVFNINISVHVILYVMNAATLILWYKIKYCSHLSGSNKYNENTTIL